MENIQKPEEMSVDDVAVKAEVETDKAREVLAGMGSSSVPTSQQRGESLQWQLIEGNILSPSSL